MPIEKLEDGAWLHPARLPLGAGWSGHCAAPGHEGEVPAATVLQNFCNLGYATDCNWLPPQRAWDAVRFAVTVEGNAASQSVNANRGDTYCSIRIRYVCERDHRPVENGTLEFDIQQATWTVRHDDNRVQKMAECFLESYLRKKRQT